MGTIRIIGCGNLQRGDDAAGILVVHRLRELGIDAEEAGDEILRTMTVWKPEEHVILVDAAQSDASPGTVLRFQPEDLTRHVRALRFSTHGIGLADMVGLADALGRLPQRLSVIGIVGANFAAGAKLTPAVREAIEDVAAELAAIYQS